MRYALVFVSTCNIIIMWCRLCEPAGPTSRPAGATCELPNDAACCLEQPTQQPACTEEQLVGINVSRVGLKWRPVLWHAAWNSQYSTRQERLATSSGVTTWSTIDVNGDSITGNSADVIWNTLKRTMKLVCNIWTVWFSFEAQKNSY